MVEAALFPDIRRGRRRQHRLNAHAFAGELVLQRLSERKDIRPCSPPYTPLSLSGTMPTTDPMLMIVPAPRATKAGATA